jgi:hypothetical protein
MDKPETQSQKTGQGQMESNPRSLSRIVLQCMAWTMPAYFIVFFILIKFAGVGWAILGGACCCYIDCASWTLGRKAARRASSVPNAADSSTTSY